MSADLACPKCGDAEPLGVEVRGVYDGVLFWKCGACGHAWNRWPRARYEHLHDRAQTYVDAVNA